MAKTINRLAVQQSLVQNGMAEHEAAGNVANVLGDEIDGAMADLVTKRDLDEAVAQINKRMDDGNAELRLEIADLRADFATLRGDMEARDRERAERESEWWRQQQERDDKWRKEQQARDDARQKRDDEWRKEMQARDDKAREEQQKRDDKAHAREVAATQAAAKMTSRILWAIFGSAGALGAAVGIALAFTGG